ncbi:MAG: tyrosine-type recombinase/integrase [Lachnospiraceae bacterium]|nr:tyrosine-type recombinase/integrase [Lachnospiraceae bacterium]
MKHVTDLPQNIRLHGLRSSCVSILVREGFDVKQIQKWVGHADPETMLKIYAKVKAEQAKEDISSKNEFSYSTSIGKKRGCEKTKPQT